MAAFRLLSIDGGGIRGIIPARLLAEIEARKKRPICELFDVIAGTSTGGILALGLTVGVNGKPRFAASELIDLYARNGAVIFENPGGLVGQVAQKVPFLRELAEAIGIPYGASVHDLFRPKYDAAGRLAVLREYFGEARVDAALARVFVVAYDTELRVPVFFDSEVSADEEYFDQIRDASVVDAAMATSAAPTYFPPHLLRERREFSLVDGGVFANNPVTLAYAFTRPADADRDVILSVGTGAITHPYVYKEIEDWGAIRWASPALYMMLDGQSEAAALAMTKLAPAGARFFRWQKLLREGDVPDDMDEATEANIAKIRAFAERLVIEKDEEIDALCAIL